MPSRLPRWNNGTYAGTAKHGDVKGNCEGNIPKENISRPGSGEDMPAI